MEQLKTELLKLADQIICPYDGSESSPYAKLKAQRIKELCQAKADDAGAGEDPLQNHCNCPEHVAARAKEYKRQLTDLTAQFRQQSTDLVAAQTDNMDLGRQLADLQALLGLAFRAGIEVRPVLGDHWKLRWRGKYWDGSKWGVQALCHHTLVALSQDINAALAAVPEAVAATEGEAGEGVVGFCPKCGCDGEADAKLADLTAMWERASSVTDIPGAAPAKMKWLDEAWTEHRVYLVWGIRNGKLGVHISQRAACGIVRKWDGQKWIYGEHYTSNGAYVYPNSQEAILQIPVAILALVKDKQ